MRFSEQWLREWVQPQIDTRELVEQLTMAGLEVGLIEPAARKFSGIVVGRVVAVEPHPKSDRLHVCRVDVGQMKELNIVCGATNVCPGILVPTALIGAVLPSDVVIKKSKLHGVESCGMLCSEQELGLGESTQGLMILPDDSPVGADVRTVLGLDDQCIELELTPNRGDCLSIAGIAREVGALNDIPLMPPAEEEVGEIIDDVIGIDILAPTDCPRYVGRIIRGIDHRVETPLWMRERLRRSGIRSLGPLIDVTNYILLELGQPMHAFDLATIKGGIRVRRAVSAEELSLLNGKVELDADTLVISDHERALALAGIMGGGESAVSDTTTDVFLESAFFSPASIAGRARRYGLQTDSSQRFERGVDPQLQRRAIERATALLLKIAGGKPGPVVEQLEETSLPQIKPITLRATRIERVLGITVEDKKVSTILHHLGMQVEEGSDGWVVTPPSFRFDVRIEEDLIEEIGRIHGYDAIPCTPPQMALAMLSQSEGQIPLQRLRSILIERGYHETITYSFIDPVLLEKLAPQDEALRLSNPITSDMAAMRTSLWPGLLKVLQYNINRQQDQIRLFETGTRFIRRNGEWLQEMMLAGLSYGNVWPEQWGEATRRLDFFDMKGDIETVIASAGVDFSCVAARHPALHPGRCASLRVSGEEVGWLGALHPAVASGMDIKGEVYLFELLLASVQRRNVPNYSEIAKYPAIRRDLAIIVPKDTTAREVFDCIDEVAPEHLTNLKLFDVYCGKHIDPGRKSLALGLTLRAQSRTLTDDEVTKAIEQIVDNLGRKLGAILRDQTWR